MAFKADLNYDKKLFKKEVLISFGNGTVALPSPSCALCFAWRAQPPPSSYVLLTV